VVVERAQRPRRTPGPIDERLYPEQGFDAVIAAEDDLKVARSEYLAASGRLPQEDVDALRASADRSPNFRRAQRIAAAVSSDERA
jgi:hypothetical protein